MIQCLQIIAGYAVIASAVAGWIGLAFIIGRAFT